MPQRYLIATFLMFMAVPSAADEPGARDFDDVHAQWKATDAEIDELIKSYRTAEIDEKPKLVKQYELLIKKSRELLPLLRRTAIARYLTAPNEDKQATEVLIGLLANDLRTDRYEDVLKLGQLLADNDCPESVVNALVGVAAYSVDDFAAAEAHLEKAKAAKVLSPSASNCLKDLPTAMVAWREESALRKQEAIADDLPRVRLETNKGPLIVELYENEAPQAVGNFISLVESKYYDGLTFHRVLAGFMAQGGCPDGTGRGGPGYAIFCECQQENHRKHFRGTLSMAHAGKDTGGSQFFLTFKRTSHLDGRHTVFGRVIKGLELLADLQRIDPSSASGPNPDIIVKAEVIRKRDHKYRPTKVSDKE